VAGSLLWRLTERAHDGRRVYCDAADGDRARRDHALGAGRWAATGGDEVQLSVLTREVGGCDEPGTGKEPEKMLKDKVAVIHPRRLMTLEEIANVAVLHGFRQSELDDRKILST
jgi:hypothetical protein